jgi:hypothetical protein
VARSIKLSAIPTGGKSTKNSHKETASESGFKAHHTRSSNEDRKDEVLDNPEP